MGESTWSQRSVGSLRDLPWTWNRPLRIARRPHVTALFPADSFWSHRQFPHQEVMRSFIFDLPERWFVYFLDVFLLKWWLKKRSSSQIDCIGTEGIKQEFCWRTHWEQLIIILITLTFTHLVGHGSHHPLNFKMVQSSIELKNYVRYTLGPVNQKR